MCHKLVDIFLDKLDLLFKLNGILLYLSADGSNFSIKDIYSYFKENEYKYIYSFILNLVEVEVLKKSKDNFVPEIYYTKLSV